MRLSAGWPKRCSKSRCLCIAFNSGKNLTHLLPLFYSNPGTGNSKYFPEELNSAADVPTLLQEFQQFQSFYTLPPDWGPCRTTSKHVDSYQTFARTDNFSWKWGYIAQVGTRWVGGGGGIGKDFKDEQNCSELKRSIDSSTYWIQFWQTIDSNKSPGWANIDWLVVKDWLIRYIEGNAKNIT